MVICLFFIFHLQERAQKLEAEQRTRDFIKSQKNANIEEELLKRQRFSTNKYDRRYSMKFSQ